MQILKIIIFISLLLNSLLVFSQDPNPPLITHISVNHDIQQVEINWVNSSPNVIGYVVYFEDISGLWIPLDTVLGINNNFYLTSYANPQQQIEKFSVVAFDNDGNSSVRSEAHSTIFLNFTYENCDTNLFLNWNNYLNMYFVNSYQLKVIREDLISGIISQEKTIPISLLDTLFSFPIEYSSKYTMWIEALSSLNYTSKSNQLQIITTELDVPTYSYINRVSVIDENSIEISVLSDSEDLSHVNLYKSNLENGFQFYLGKANLVNDEFIRVDPIVLPDRNVYYYQSKPVDICGKEYNLSKFTGISDVSKSYNLKLDEISVSQEFISVKSNDYDNFLSNSHLEIWKEVNEKQTYLQDALPNTNYNISIINDLGRVCTYLISTENTNNILNKKDTVYSNKVCISKSPKLYIPNSFTPKNNDLKNNTWKIIVYGKDAISSFNLKIFNRWGQLMFESNNVNDEWNGTTNNLPSEEGVYFYNIQIEYANEQQLHDSGSIFLLR